MHSHQPPLLTPPTSWPPAKAAGPLVPLDAQKVLSPRAWSRKEPPSGQRDTVNTEGEVVPVREETCVSSVLLVSGVWLGNHPFIK